MPEQPEPSDPLTSLAASAVALHELFRAYIDAGFTENQALYLVGQLLRPRSEPS